MIDKLSTQEQTLTQVSFSSPGTEQAWMYLFQCLNVLLFFKYINVHKNNIVDTVF